MRDKWDWTRRQPFTKRLSSLHSPQRPRTQVATTATTTTTTARFQASSAPGHSTACPDAAETWVATHWQVGEGFGFLAGPGHDHRIVCPPPAVILAPERKGKKSTSVTRLEAGWAMSTPMDFRWTLVLVAGGEFGAEHFYCWSGARLSPVVVVVGWVTWLERRLRWLPGTTRRSSAPC